jgi:hypothetical protein
MFGPWKKFGPLKKFASELSNCNVCFSIALIIPLLPPAAAVSAPAGVLGLGVLGAFGVPAEPAPVPEPEPAPAPVPETVEVKPETVEVKPEKKKSTKKV